MMLGIALYQIVYEKNGRLSGLPFFFAWNRFFGTVPTRLPFRREGDAQLCLLTEVIHHDEFQLGRFIAHASVV